MATDPLAQLDQRIALLRKRLEAAERMREAVKDDPELLQLLNASEESSALPPPVNGAARPRRGRRKRDGHPRIHGGPAASGYFKSVADYLESQGNKPQPIPEIAHATGLQGNNVIGTIYRTHAILFESHPVPGHATRKAWNLRKDWREIIAEIQQK